MVSEIADMVICRCINAGDLPALVVRKFNVGTGYGRLTILLHKGSALLNYRRYNMLDSYEPSAATTPVTRHSLRSVQATIRDARYVWCRCVEGILPTRCTVAFSQERLRFKIWHMPGICVRTYVRCRAVVYEML